MTDKQKAAFLRTEGWKKMRNSIYWTGPSQQKGWDVLAPFPDAYRIASRRKGARDHRRLVKAGFIYTTHYGWKRGPRDGYLSTGQGYFCSKSEALKILAGQE